jgi:hypothetical protein
MTPGVFVFAFFSYLCNAQLPPAHIIMGGGLLGKLDGFCEKVTSPSDSTSCPSDRMPYGGLYGFRQQIQGMRGSDAYLIVTGNNLPKDFNANATYGDGTFWKIFQSLEADVTALGQDDLLRAVFPAKIDLSQVQAQELNQPNPKPPSRFTSSVLKTLQGANPKFLASNAAVRTNRTGMHKTWIRGYELSISADQSIPWTTSKLGFSVPDAHHKTVSATLETGGQAIFRDTCIDLSAGAGSVPVKLRPGLTYKFTIVDLPETIEFTFQVDAALTPWANSGNLSNLPIAAISHNGASPLLVASVVDPTVLDILDPREWKDGDGEGALGLVLYPPADAAKYLLAAAGTSSAIPVLLTDLSDASAAQVASSSAAWRLISFSGDSHLLGCESGDKGCGKGRAAGYNSGAIAVFDATSPRSRIWARPEWIGETIDDIIAAPLAGSGWSITSAVSVPVAGGRSPGDANKIVTIGEQSYPPPPGRRIMINPPSNKKLRVWWRSRQDMAVVLMDAMRGKLHTDLTFADQRVIDGEVLDELSDLADTGMLSLISTAELKEILWRHDPYTVIKITGKDLVTALGKLSRLTADDDGGGVCVRGLGGAQFQQPCGIPDSTDTKRLEINGRFYVADEFYSVALPQSLARGAGLAYPRTTLVNVFDTVLQYLRTVNWDKVLIEKQDSSTCKDLPKPSPLPTTVAVPAQSPLLPTAQVALMGGAAARPPTLVWPNLMEKKLLSLFYVPPASIEFGGQNFSVPVRNGSADTSGFNAIPLVGEKAQHIQKFNVTSEVHFTPIDLHAISLDFSSKVNLNRLETFPTTSTGFPSFSYTPDQWTVGATLRSKVMTEALTKAVAPALRRILPTNKRPVLRIQPFVGYFDDTSVFHYTATLIQKIKVDSNTTIQQPLFENDAKPNYAYLGAGMELGEIAMGKYFKFSNTRLEQDWGMNYAAPQKVFIRGKENSMEDVRRCGIQGLIDGGTNCSAAPTTGPLEVRYQYATQAQSRRQFLTTLSFSIGPDNKKETFSVDVKANQWGRGPNGFMPLDPEHTLELNFKTAFPIGAGITIGPYYRYLTVTAHNSDTNFISRRYGFTLNIPLTAKRGHGRFFF